MSRLAKKFFLGISAIMAGVILLSIFLNAHFIGRYFLYREKQELHRVCDSLVAADSEGRLMDAVEEARSAEDVILAWVEGTEDNNELNQRLKTAFLKEGISLERYWLWDQDQRVAMEQGRRLRMYTQEKLHYSLLVEYLSMGQHFIAAAKIVPSTADTIALVNRVTGMIFMGAAAVILVLVALLIRKITGPLLQIGNAARSIAALDFQHVEVHTGDELEDLAKDMNGMSEKLARSHRDLEEKNRQMESLLSNVSHDLKTPAALIKAYAQGIKDGMDDGTFLDTILRQNDRMSGILERLLEYAKVGSTQTQREACDLSYMLEETLAANQMRAESRGISFTREITQELTLTANRDAVTSIYENLVSNAVKYAAGSSIAVSLKSEKGIPVFSIRNQVVFENPVLTERLWEPFYVVDEARSASGTGLGLAIVRAITQKHGYTGECRLENGEILFTIIFVSGSDFYSHTP